MGKAAGTFLVVSLVLFPLFPGSSRSAEAPPELERLVAARVAVERVYWEHRIWPESNPGPKPGFEESVPVDLLRARVENTLLKSAALEQFWRRPIAADQLQAEIDRMARDTRRPDVLLELFEALDHDPQLIVETLARPALTNRLARNYYSMDERLHGGLRKLAESERATLAAALAGTIRDGPAPGSPESGEATSSMLETIRASGRPVADVVWKRAGSDEVATRDDPGIQTLDPDEYLDFLGDLAARFRIAGGNGGTALELLPVGGMSPLREDTTGFTAVVVLETGGDFVHTVTISWEKTPFDVWWNDAKKTLQAVEPPVAEYRVPPISPTACADDTWTRTRDDVSEPRTLHTAVWTGSEMIVWGGRQSGELNTGDLNTGSRYDPATDTWAPVNDGPTAPGSRHNHTAIWTGTEMVVWGGGRGFLPTSQLDTGGRYDPATDSWTPTSTGAGTPSKRRWHTAVWTGSKMIVWGGSPDLVTGLSDGGLYDPATDTWTPTPSDINTPSRRYLHVAVLAGTRMFVWGGTDGTFFFNNGALFDESSGTWSSAGIFGGGLPPPVTSPTAVWTGSRVLVWGGSSFGPVNTGGQYDPITALWTPITPGSGSPGARNFHTAVWTGSRMIIWGGRSGSGAVNTGSSYDPVTDTWSNLGTAANTPAPRFNHTAVWTGPPRNEMIVYGGEDGNVFYRSGGRYATLSGTWVPIGLNANVPVGRRVHTSVWTGAEMIVWGGRSPNGFLLDTGSRYDPVSDTWTPTSTVSVPLRRINHTAVWTGTRMIVWGGYSSGFLDNGGSYDPVGDRWRPVAVDPSTPTPRHLHTAVWTGTEMIVWGGLGKSTGGRYDPATDSWTPTSIGAGVPTGRSDHTAVWTGPPLNLMIVWGGSNTNTGGRYDPATDTWTPTSTGANVPAPRLNHTAVWTGALTGEMLVWGGSPNLDTGGRYDPAADLWTPMNTMPLLGLGRGVHTAVWTGSEMIVWGGAQSGSSVNTGGRYDPILDDWKLTSTGANVPAPRHLHTAEWDGQEMIVWGGTSFTAGKAKQSGGRYCAVAP